MFPFSDVPRKDSTKIQFDLVRVTSNEEQRLVFHFLDLKGLKPVNETMFDDDPRTLAIPLNPKDKTFGYVGIHVLAEQVYHGANIYDVQSYIKK